VIGKSFSIFDFVIPTFAFIHVIAFSASLLYLFRSQRGIFKSKFHFLEFSIYLFLITHLGAHIAGWLENSIKLSDLINNKYGSNFLGGLTFGSIFVLFFAKIQKLDFFQLFDNAAMALLIGISIGRIGCFLTGDGCYGVPTDLPWGMAFPNGITPTSLKVHPTSLYESLAYASVFLYYKIRKTDNCPPYGLLGCKIMICYSIIRFAVEFIRTNTKFMGLSQAQWISLFILFCASGCMYFLKKDIKSSALIQSSEILKG